MKAAGSCGGRAAKQAGQPRPTARRARALSQAPACAPAQAGGHLRPPSAAAGSCGGRAAKRARGSLGQPRAARGGGTRPAKLHLLSVCYLFWARRDSPSAQNILVFRYRPPPRPAAAIHGGFSAIAAGASVRIPSRPHKKKNSVNAVPLGAQGFEPRTSTV
ncbi:MAG: hypothetical protein Pg6A_07120 [Termitinemataceae bacterium]|nr:MAG: hypothetical protein Pg6A_07120 [Termitinemataceae bacterium]